MVLMQTASSVKEGALEANTPEVCHMCGHAFDPHALFTTAGFLGAQDKREHIQLGGIVLCPHPGCTCFATWSAKNMGNPGEEDVMPYIPTEDEIRNLREELQTGQRNSEKIWTQDEH